MKFRLFVLTMLSALPCVADPASAILAPAPRVDMIHDIVMGKGGDKVLHAEIIRPHVMPANPIPAVIFIHGGGWFEGSQKKVSGVLATRGYLVASIEYRLSGEAPWPAQIEDCKLGVRWLRANAAKYHVDPDRIACWGHSAGGHLAACVGTMDSPALEGTGGYPGVSSKVDAVIDSSGPTDFTKGNFGLGSATIDKDGLASDESMEEKLFGVSFAKNPAIYREASPITWVHAGDPPFLILHGENDAVVSPTNATDFAAALKKAGVPVQLVLIKNGVPKGHAIAGGTPDVETIWNDMSAFLDRYLKK
jgi:acetyl esterase/lipase